MKKVFEFIKNNIFAICIFAISLVRFHLVQRLPIMAYPREVYDDQLMVKLAKSIIEGKWLGSYDSNTLIKACGFPLFLTVLKYFNISYLFSMNVLYIFSCLYFIYSIKDDIKNKLFLVIIYGLMIFNPISFSNWTLQRIYRNGPGIFQTIFIFSGIYIVFKNRRKAFKKLIPHIILISIMSAMMWNTREDSIWMIPFLIVSIMIICADLIINNLKNTKFDLKKVLVKVCILTIPFISIFISSLCIKFVNYNVYGVFVLTESESNLGKVINTLYRIKQYENIPYVDNTRNKISKLYNVSKTLESIKPELEASLDVWSKYDRNPNDNEVENGWFSWVLKDAVQNAGYYQNAKMSDEFYKKVNDELLDAIKNGKIEEDIILLKSYPAWRKEYAKEIVKNIFVYLKYIITYKDMSAENYACEEGINVSDLKISDFEFVSSNFAIHRKSSNCRICGWYFLKNESPFTLYLTNELNQIICEIPMMESSDIINAYGLTKNQNYRFDINIIDIENVTSFNELFICSYDENNNLIERISVNTYIPNAMIETDNSKYLISMVFLETINDPNQQFSNMSVKILNKIIFIYSKICVIMAFISIVCFIKIIIKMIIEFKKSKKISNNIDVVLILLGIILSFFVVLLGFIYAGITFCNTLIYMYLAVCYPLFIMFINISIFYSLRKN